MNILNRNNVALIDVLKLKIEFCITRCVIVIFFYHPLSSVYLLFIISPSVALTSASAEFCVIFNTSIKGTRRDICDPQIWFPSQSIPSRVVNLVTQYKIFNVFNINFVIYVFLSYIFTKRFRVIFLQFWQNPYVRILLHCIIWNCKMLHF